MKKTQPGDKIILVNSTGMAIVFDEGDVRTMGRMAIGVKGITLADGEKVVDVDKFKPGADLVLATEKGYGKRTSLKLFRVQKRGGKGLKAINLSKKTGAVIGAKVVVDEEELMLLTENGILIRLAVEDISRQGRYTRGIVLMRLDAGDRIASIAHFKSDEEAV